MTDLHTFALLLILAGSLGLLLGLLLLVMARRPRSTRIDADTPDVAADTEPTIDLHELLEARTTRLYLVPRHQRKAGSYFRPHDGPLTPEPPEGA